MYGAVCSRSIIVVTIVAADRSLCVEVIVKAIVTSGIPVGAQRKSIANAVIYGSKYNNDHHSDVASITDNVALAVKTS